VKRVIHYLNLTNGIEAIEKLNLKDYRFIRIQSTACEQKRWGFILQDLDYDFLMNLVQGNPIIVYDYSAKKRESRALYQGIPWIKFVLNKIWFNKDIKALVKTNDVTAYFESEFRKLDRKTLNKLKYFRKFLNTDKLNLYHFSKNTIHDGDIEYFLKVLKGEGKELLE
jgi:hypothetical protein